MKRIARITGATVLLACAIVAAAALMAFQTLFAASAAPPEGAVPPLWTRAVAVFEANKNLVPGSMLQVMEELDGDGKVKSRSETQLRFSSGGPDSVTTEIVSATEDGKDVTAKEREKLAKQQEKTRKEKAKQAKSDEKKNEKKDGERSQSVSSNDSPFAEAAQKDIRVVDTGRRETERGRRCAVLEFTYPQRDRDDPKAKPFTVKGTAWIDEETSAPLRVDSTRDPLPRGAKRMSSTFIYAPRPDGSLVLSEMRFEGEGGFLFINKRFRMKATFADHWLFEESKK